MYISVPSSPFFLTLSAYRILCWRRHSSWTWRSSRSCLPVSSTVTSRPVRPTLHRSIRCCRSCPTCARRRWSSPAPTSSTVLAGSATRSMLSLRRALGLKATMTSCSKRAFGKGSLPRFRLYQASHLISNSNLSCSHLHFLVHAGSQQPRT